MADTPQQASSNEFGRVSLPVGSELPIGRDHGKPCAKKLGDRIKNALHLPAKHDGQVDVVIPSCKAVQSQMLQSAEDDISVSDAPMGYPRTAPVADLDQDFVIYRKFGWLHNYALLYLQDELSELQEDLDRLNDEEFNRLDDEKFNRQAISPDSQRKELLVNIDSKLAQYGGLLLKLEAVHARQRPTVKRWRNSYDLIKDTQSVESTRDLGLDRREPDLTVLRGLDQDGWLSSSLREILAKVWRTATNAILSTPELKAIDEAEDNQFLSSGHVDVGLQLRLSLAQAILVASMLLGPAFMLSELQLITGSKTDRENAYQFLTIILSTLVCSALCYICMSTSHAFATTVAYASVLMIFLRSVSHTT